MPQARMHTSKVSLQSYALLAYFMAVFAMPFTGMAGPSFLGELARCLSVWFVIPAILFSLTIYNVHNPSTASLIRFGSIFVGLLALGFVFNITDITDIEFRNRSGLNKYLTSLLVVLYGFGFSWVTANVVSSDGDINSAIRRYILRPTLVTTLVTGCVAIVEVAWWYIPSLGNLMNLITLILRPFSEEAGFWGRLTTVAFEPHAFGLWLCFALIIMVWAILWEKKQSPTVVYLFGFFAAAIMLYLSQARGGIIVAFATIGMTFLLLIFKSKPHIYSKIALVPLIGCISICLIQMTFVEQISNYALNGTSISNLSRYGMNVASFNMFYDNPFIGVGLGQFAFHATSYIPAWGWYSSEINAWLIDEINGWPSTYSAYGRLLSETGFAGFVAWYLGTYLIIRKAVLVQVAAGNSSLAALLLLLMTFNFFFGISMETFNHLGLWITLGIASAAIAKPAQAQTE